LVKARKLDPPLFVLSIEGLGVASLTNTRKLCDCIEDFFAGCDELWKLVLTKIGALVSEQVPTVNGVAKQAPGVFCKVVRWIGDFLRRQVILDQGLGRPVFEFPVVCFQLSLVIGFAVHYQRSGQCLNCRYRCNQPIWPEVMIL
jgi:hypothetical protein